MLRYLLDADQWDHLDSTEPLTPEDMETMEEVYEVSLKEDDLLVHTDGDDEYLILRLKG